MRRFGDKWARETYVFLKRFESEGYLLRLPREPAGFDNFPSPRGVWKLSAPRAELGRGLL